MTTKKRYDWSDLQGYYLVLRDDLRPKTIGAVTLYTREMHVGSVLLHKDDLLYVDAVCSPEVAVYTESEIMNLEERYTLRQTGVITTSELRRLIKEGSIARVIEAQEND